MKLIISIFFLFAFVCCNSGNKSSKIYVSDNCKGNFRKISFKSIIDSLSAYDHQPIEIIGYYHYAFEMSAISSKRNSQNEKARIWVEYNNALVDSLEKDTSPNDNVFYKMNGKKIKIKGIVYADDQGHLSQYACSIKYICFLEVFD